MKYAALFLITLFCLGATHAQKLIPFQKSLYKCGLKNSEGKVVVKPIYNSVEDDGFHFILHGKNNQTATLMTYEGKVLIPPIYIDLKNTGDRRYYKATAFNEQYKKVMGYVDLSGQPIIPVKYFEIEDYYKARFLETRSQYGQYGLIGFPSDSTMFGYKELTPPVHQELSIKTLSTGAKVILVRDIQDRYAVIDANGKMIKDYVDWFLPIRTIFVDEWRVMDRKTKKWGLANGYLDLILPLEYEYISHDRTNKNQYIVQKGGKYGIVDKNGKQVVETKYQKLANLECSMIPVMLNNKWGILDIKGKLILPFEYDSIGDCSVFEIDLKKDNKWRRVDIYTDKAKTKEEEFESVLDAFNHLSKRIVKQMDEFAYAQKAIQQTKFTTEYELQKRYTELLNTKGYDIKQDLRKAMGLLLDFLNRHPEVSKTDRDLVNTTVRELERSWNYLDKSKSYKDTVFTVKEETVGGVIDEVLKKYEK